MTALPLLQEMSDRLKRLDAERLVQHRASGLPALWHTSIELNAQLRVGTPQNMPMYDELNSRRE